MKKILSTALVVSCLLFQGCLQTAQMLQNQQRKLLSDEIQQTSVVLKQLDQTPNPERANQFSVFIPVQILNEIFKKADGLFFDPTDPNLKNARIVLESL